MTVLGAHLSLRWSEPGAVLTVKPCPVFHEYFRMFAGRILTVPCPPRCTCHPCFSLIGALVERGTPSPRVSPVILKHVGQAVPSPGAIIHGVFLTAAPPPNPDAGQGKWFRFYRLKMQGLEKEQPASWPRWNISLGCLPACSAACSAVVCGLFLKSPPPRPRLSSNPTCSSPYLVSRHGNL